MYFVSNTDDAICSYNLLTKDYTENILLDYPSSARVDTINSLYVADYGFTIIYDTSWTESALIQLDFDGSIRGEIKNVPSGLVPADVNMLVGYEYESQDLVFIDLSDMKQIDTPVDFEPGSISVSDGYLYVSDTTNSDKSTIIKYGLYSDECLTIKKLDAATYNCFVSKGKIYYPATYGTAIMFAKGSGWAALNDNYELNQICFSDDGKLYAIGQDPNNEMFQMQYTRYFIRMNTDGTGLEILDEEDVDFSD